MAADDPQQKQMRERLDRIRCSFDQWRISYELHRPEGGRWVAWRIDPLEEWEAEAGLTCVVSAWDHDTFLARLGAEQRRQDELRARLRQEEEEGKSRGRSEEHTSELQSRPHLVCRLLLEKKKKKRTRN